MAYKKNSKKYNMSFQTEEDIYNIILKIAEEYDVSKSRIINLLITYSLREEYINDLSNYLDLKIKNFV
jgi:serine protease inhibitor